MLLKIKSRLDIVKQRSSNQTQCLKVVTMAKKYNLKTITTKLITALYKKIKANTHSVTIATPQGSYSVARAAVEA